MIQEDRRIFKRYISQSGCEVRIDSHTYNGKILDYSEGVGAVIENIQELAIGTPADIKVPDLDMEFRGEVAWSFSEDNNCRVGFRRIGDFSGNLRHFKLADILVGIHRGTKTGTLEVTSGSAVKRVFLNNGDMIFASSTKKDDRLGELLLKAGKITLEDYNQASYLLIKTGQRLGKILVDLGLLTPKELFRAVRYQIEEIIISLFTIEEGHFEIKEEPLPTEELITLQISTANIIYRGMKRVNNFTYVHEMCPDENMLLSVSRSPLNIFQSLTLEETDKKILSYVNGSNSLKRILSLSPASNFDTMKTISALQSIRLVTTEEKIIIGLDEEHEDIPIEDIFSEPDAETPEKFLEKIEEMIHKCDTLGYNEVLGVKNDASMETIKKSYYLLSKQFHPDRHLSFPSHDIKRKLIKIFSYVTEAYLTLARPDNGEEYRERRSITSMAPVKESTEDYPSSADATIEEGTEEDKAPSVTKTVSVDLSGDIAAESAITEESELSDEEPVPEHELHADGFGDEQAEAGPGLAEAAEEALTQEKREIMEETQGRGFQRIELPGDITEVESAITEESELSDEEPVPEHELHADGFGDEQAEAGPGLAEAAEEALTQEEREIMEETQGRRFQRIELPGDITEAESAITEGSELSDEEPVPEHELHTDGFGEKQAEAGPGLAEVVEETPLEEIAGSIDEPEIAAGTEEPLLPEKDELEQYNHRGDEVRVTTAEKVEDIGPEPLATTKKSVSRSRKSRSKKIWLSVSVVLFVTILSGSLILFYDNVKELFSHSAPVQTKNTALPSFHEEAFTKSFPEVSEEKTNLPSFRDDAFKQVLRD